MAIAYPGPPSAELYGRVHRLRLAPSRTYCCRVCRGSMRVTASRYLPDACPSCGAGTWEPDGRCANWIGCGAVRRPDRRQSHCHACGHSVWVLAPARSRAPGG